MKYRLNYRLIYLFCALMTLAAIAQADTIRILDSGKNSLLAMASLIDSARSSIDVTTYIFQPCDRAPKTLLAKLIEASERRHVKVRLLIDAFESRDISRGAFTESMRRHGIEVRYYNSSVSKMNPASNFRTHGKLLLIDGKRYISGGRNWSDQYFGLDSGVKFFDRDLDVEGPSARDAQATFHRLWSARASFVEDAPTARETKSFEARCLSPDKTDSQVAQFIQAKSARSLPNADIYRCGDTRFYFDHPEFYDADAASEGPSPFNDPNEYLQGMRWTLKETTRAVFDLLRLSQKSVFIENWAYLPSTKFENLLLALRERSVRIRVYSNFVSDAGPSMDILAHRAAARDNTGSEKVRLISTQSPLADRWELTPKDSKSTVSGWLIHSKVMTIDGVHALVGSFNFDPRSYSSNLETAVIVKNCPALAERLGRDEKALESVLRHDACAKKNSTCSKPEASFLDLGTLIFGELF